MPSMWFRGGQEALYNGSSAWNSADIRASVVQGTGIQTQVGWQTIGDFKGSNTLIGSEASLPAAPNRGSGWQGAINGFEYWYNDPLNFGVIPVSTPMAGVVFYEGSEAAGTGAVWFASEQSGGHEVSDGGDYSWESSGKNVAAEMRCLSVSNRYSFQGSLDIIDIQPSIWQDGTWRIGYALVRDTTTQTPLRAWRYMSDLDAYSIFYCAGASPGNANMPETLVADREGPAIALNTDGDYYEYGIVGTGRTPITWNSPDLQAGEVVAAVIAFLYAGTYSAAAARIISWDDVANHTIQAAQNVTYGQTSAFSVNRVIL